MTGERLKEVLLTFKISQTDIAKKIGMSQQSLNQMLGASDVKSGLLEKIANAINVSVSRLYDMACCGSISDPNAPFENPPSDGTYNGLTTDSHGRKDDVKDERIKLLEEKVAFLQEQVDFYKNKKKQ